MMILCSRIVKSGIIIVVNVVDNELKYKIVLLPLDIVFSDEEYCSKLVLKILL